MAASRSLGWCESAVPEHRQDLVVLREATRLVLGEYLLVIDDDVEDPIATGGQFGLDASLTLDSGRQTGGLGQVVSLLAVGDRNLHNGILPQDWCVRQGSCNRQFSEDVRQLDTTSSSSAITTQSLPESLAR